MKKLTLLWLLSFGICLAQEVVEKPAVELTDAEQQNLDLSKQFPRVAQQENVAKFDQELLKSAAMKGDAWAQFYMGKSAYFDKKHKEALKWYAMSSKQNHAPSLINTGAIHEHGLANDGKPDYTKALDYYERAAKEGHRSAWFNLAGLYRDAKGVEEDREKAFKYYSLAAALGHPDATSEVGACFEHGKGVERNGKLAFMFYEKSKENGSVIAISNLGSCYVLGIGVEEDPVKAVAYFKESAEKKCPHGTRMLGLCYERGVGVDADRAKAREWYEKAVALGDKRAKENLEGLKK